MSMDGALDGWAEVVKAWWKWTEESVDVERLVRWEGVFVEEGVMRKTVGWVEVPIG